MYSYYRIAILKIYKCRFIEEMHLLNNIMEYSKFECLRGKDYIEWQSCMTNSITGFEVLTF